MKTGEKNALIFQMKKEDRKNIILPFISWKENRHKTDDEIQLMEKSVNTCVCGKAGMNKKIK